MSAITSIKTNIYPFVQAMVVTTLSEIALGGTRGPFVRRKIRALTTLTPPGLIAIQRIWSLASLNIITMLFLSLRSRLCFQGDDDLFANRKKIILIEIYNSVVISPIIEELFFRGVVQEFFLRQLPKFALRLLTMNAELVDVPAFNTIREK